MIPPTPNAINGILGLKIFVIEQFLLQNHIYMLVRQH